MVNVPFTNDEGKACSALFRSVPLPPPLYFAPTEYHSTFTTRHAVFPSLILRVRPLLLQRGSMRRPGSTHTKTPPPRGASPPFPPPWNSLRLLVPQYRVVVLFRIISSDTTDTFMCISQPIGKASSSLLRSTCTCTLYRVILSHLRCVFSLEDGRDSSLIDLIDCWCERTEYGVSDRYYYVDGRCKAGLHSSTVVCSTEWYPYVGSCVCVQ
jgi:hypothetical protein